MIKYVLKRLTLLVPVLIGVSIIVFVIMHVLTSDPTSIILGQHASADQIAALRKQLGLDNPLYIQYLDFLKGLLHRDFGNSLITQTSVWSELTTRLPATVELAFTAIIIASIVGVTIGVISAIKQNSIVDYISMLGALLGVSMPIFWLGLILIVIFSLQLHILPVSSRIQVGMEPVHITGFYILDSIFTGNMAALQDSIKHLMLPAIALAAYSTAIIARMTRSTMLEVIGQDYIRTARAKGLGERKIIIGHALKNAFIPIITVIGLQLGSLLGGAVLTETVFAWPGIGSYTIEAILKSDYPVVQGAVMLMAVIFVSVNLLVDLIYGLLDPRIKYS
ncbi:ABC transporter permease [Clostridium magnum]|uniref:Dipeptide transport system permease protein DppB n=1 Tax=Clostridium magnum DSM 2767 TaxID=1121326 RepID=A0A161YNL1_9CLOT|nr:ABC transporter permease [Clostridium magnum]KZL92302.1 dipeptide transport system permease protein DppB [Clostridium magnum DSM 2767]SHH14155.1 peptide/nickel transport system permease protein [Clostridium magnum DSM 2767]